MIVAHERDLGDSSLIIYQSGNFPIADGQVWNPDAGYNPMNRD